MSIVICQRCDAWVDSDEDTDCFVEVGNMRRLHKTEVMCERCREYYYDELTSDQGEPQYDSGETERKRT